MRALLLGIFMIVVPVPVLAQAELENYYNYNSRVVQPAAAEAEKPAPKMDGAKRQVVTSVQKCFEGIGPEAAAKIRARSLTPYADCQKALREKAAKDKAAAESAAAPEAETPRNFKRVTETPAEESAGDDAAKKPAAGQKSKKAVK